jgi:hypothetical protein
MLTGLNEMQRLLTLDSMGVDIPDSVFNYHMLRGLGFPGQLTRTSNPLTSTGILNTPTILTRSRGKTIKSEPTTASPFPNRRARTDISSLFSNLSPTRNANNDIFQGMNPWFMAHLMETFV